MPLRGILLVCLLLSVPAARAEAACAGGTETAAVAALDREWLLAYNNSDGRPFDRIWAEDALLVSTQGRVKTKAEEREDVTATPPPQLKAAWEVTDQIARRYCDTAVVIGRFAQVGTYDGQAFTREFRYTNVYSQFEGKWRLITSQFAPIGPAPVPEAK